MYAVKFLRKNNLFERQQTFATYELLVNWLAAANYEKLYFNGISLKSGIGNRILESAVTPGCGGEGRNILISSLETGENLYSKELLRDVTSKKFDADMEAARQAQEAALHHKERLAGWYGANYLGFRAGPVPTTGTPRHGYFYRSVRTFPALRDAVDPEVQGYIRAKRRLVPSLWDDQIISRAGTKSWKDTTRNRKQWMRGVKNGLPSKGKGLYVKRQPVGTADWARVPYEVLDVLRDCPEMSGEEFAKISSEYEWAYSWMQKSIFPKEG